MPRPRRKQKPEEAEVPQVPVAEAPTPVEKKETVEIAKADLEQLISGFRDLRSELDTVKGTISKQRLRESEESLNKNEQPRGFLRIVRGNIVQGWKSLSESQALVNNGVKDLGNGNFMEVMKMHAILLDKDEDGNPLELICDYKEHGSTTTFAYFRVVEVTQKGGETFWVCKFENEALDEKYGEVTINIKFVN